MASSSVTVCSGLRDAPSPVRSCTRPASIEACTDATISSTPNSATVRSRKVIDLVEVVPGVDVHHRERDAGGEERPSGEVEQHDGVLAAGEQQDRPLALGGDLAQDADRFVLEPGGARAVTGGGAHAAEH